jgi:dolichol-phosphate mannosyltransferase
MFEGREAEVRLTLVLPTKNEAGGIAELIREAKAYANEILVVDGHSTDGTRQIAEDCGARVVLDNKRGKGDAVRVAIAEARGEVIVFADADGSHDLADVPRLAAPVFAGTADLVLGSRIRGGSDELHGDFDNFIRAVGAGIITIAINYRWNVRLTDSLNGFRALRTDVGRQLRLRADDFDIEQHMVARALQGKFRVIELPAHESVRKWGRSKLPTYRKAWLFFRRLGLDVLGY